jgi:hypothetical protein
MALLARRKERAAILVIANHNLLAEFGPAVTSNGVLRKFCGQHRMPHITPSQSGEHLAYPKMDAQVKAVLKPPPKHRSTPMTKLFVVPGKAASGKRGGKK